DTSSEGGLGQYVIGTFTADADTQSFDFVLDTTWHVNAMQLRAVPEPSAYAAIAGVLALACVVTRRRA
ncbi:PEP-CTERM sorting domain-containing protein, partial [Coraliomargarita sp. SDUM461003]